MFEWLCIHLPWSNKEFEEHTHKINKNLPKKGRKSILLVIITWLILGTIVYFMYQRYDCYSQTGSMYWCSYYGSDIESVEIQMKKGK